jgi:uncharacterized phage protein gp47/JayE
MTYDQILLRMQEKYRELTGFGADDASDIGIRLKVLAGEAAALYGRVAELQKNTFPQTAAGGSLDLHAETRAIARKPAAAAKGVLRFSRETAAGYDISLPGGILCSTRGEPQIHFVTTEDAVLPAGETWADIPAEAAEPGESGNVASGNVCLLITGALGITGVRNPAAFSGGAGRESDDALRARLLHSYANISNTTNRAFYYDAAMSHGDVVSANVLPRRRGRGTVDVVIACHSPAEAPAAAAQLAARLSGEKEINVDVAVSPAIADTTDLRAAIRLEEGADPGIVKAAVTERLRAWLASHKVGEPLLLARLGRELLGVEGLYNYRILAPAADLATAEDHVIRPGVITIEEEPA